MARSPTPVDGILLLNKPAGITSNRALQKVKRLLGVKKAGHAGSLDPAATGMLPLCFGEATKVCAFLLDADKTYRVVARLGEATDTGDADGAVIDQQPVAELDFAQWREICAEFVGEIEQIPPMYSALKQDGKRLYELARQGQTVERQPRRIQIFELALLEAFGRRLVFRVRCSKGTYIRTLVEDVARAAGTVAHTRNLHRERVGPFPGRDMVDMGEAERRAAADALKAAMLPVDAALEDLAATALDEAATARFLQGQAVAADSAATGPVRVYGPSRRFLGVGEGAGGGQLRPKRIFHLAEK